ncbi:MAG: Penicillin-binding protein, 1A family [Candidatus Levybacteria bacterium GW2011_GWC2_40_7]|nr:MAG: Penicillin-binding protein, 1A family [Candidatus Levybacteria bacterium GW2011_GWC2_40_7]
MGKSAKILKRIRKLQKRKVILFLSVSLLACISYFFIFRQLPSPTRLGSSSAPQSSQIFDRAGQLLYTMFSEENRTNIPLSEIPKSVQFATIASEDKDFYKHGAIDIRGIIRSVFVITTKRQIQGGSTLTQQLVKNSLLTPERTIQRKVKEVVLAYATEILYSKNQILEMYLNQIPYGGTAYGIEAASQTYFGKKAKNLTIAESALLAGLPEAPTTYSPFGSRPELGKQRQRSVLAKMLEQKYITKEEYDKALKEDLIYKEFANEIKAPHFVLYIKDLLIDKYGQRYVEEGGLQIKTTLDLNIQDFAQLAVASEVAKLRGSRVSNGAAVVTNPGTGEILAMVGSKNYFDNEIDGNVNVTLALRQPGSSIKPVNYAVGLIKGYTAATPFIDEKICFPNPGGPQYCPVNYDGKFRGAIQMRYALGNSINIPAVKMLKANGVDAMLATASAMGISSFTDPSRYGLSLTLGGGEVTMLDMTRAYGVFANGGYRIDLHPILEIRDSKNKLVEKYDPPSSPIFGKKVLPEGAAYIISDILLDNGARSEAFGSNSELRIDDQPVSVKTGTTNDLRDNWTIGYTPDLLTAVWVGNNDNTPMGGVSSGVTGAAPIWNDIMTFLLEDNPAQRPVRPSSVVGMSVCAVSGLLPRRDSPCPTRFEYFIKGSQPKMSDPGKQKVFIDKNTNDLAKPGQTENVEEREQFILTDVTGAKYCLDCPHPTPTPSVIPTP